MPPKVATVVGVGTASSILVMCRFGKSRASGERNSALMIVWRAIARGGGGDATGCEMSWASSLTGTMRARNAPGASPRRRRRRRQRREGRRKGKGEVRHTKASRQAAPRTLVSNQKKNWRQAVHQSSAREAIWREPVISTPAR